YEKTIFASTVIFQGVQKLISGIVPTSEIGGVISIGKVISDASESSIIALLTITALISVNLGVLNLLPIPALDGGHIMFNLYEMIVRKKPSDKVFVFLTIMGWIILGSLMLLGIYNDINRIFLNN
ncbi:site-2 protease family protein, partial [Aliarcobacter butzleri]